MLIVESTEKIGKRRPVTIYVEMDDVVKARAEYGETLGDGKEIIEKASDIFGSGMALVRHCATSVMDTIESLGVKASPSEFEVELGIKLNSEVGAVLAKTGGEAHMQVKMRWKRQEPITVTESPKGT
jgi:hypothetical protein